MPSSCARRALACTLLLLAACDSEVDDDGVTAGSASGSGASGSAGQGGGGAGTGGDAAAGAGGNLLGGGCGDSEATLFCGYGGEFCDAPAGTCPGPGNLGQCAEGPESCEGERTQPTCGCNGQVYLNECAAHFDGVDVGPQDCTPPSSAFICGDALCEDGAQYCQSINGHDQCLALPPRCADAADLCACLEPYFCASAPGDPMCTVDAGGHATVVCSVSE
jgi:hypothetical protein